MKNFFFNQTEKLNNHIKILRIIKDNMVKNLFINYILFTVLLLIIFKTLGNSLIYFFETDFNTLSNTFVGILIFYTFYIYNLFKNKYYNLLNILNEFYLYKDLWNDYLNYLETKKTNILSEGEWTFDNNIKKLYLKEENKNKENKIIFFMLREDFNLKMFLLKKL